MKGFTFVAFLAVCCTSLIVLSSASSLSKDQFRGIAPEDEKYYKSSEVIKCKDGSKKFAISQLNDDFCDCPDGSDEPGTSACPNGKFYCRNAGHVPILLFSSRVNDGICDCCDGSDEYDGTIKCQNTCWEAGKVARDKLTKKIATFQEGVTIRKRQVEQAKVSLAKDKEELSRLKDEEKVLKGLVQQLQEHKDQIEKAEERERVQREKEEKERKEAEEKAEREKIKTEVETGKESKEGEVKAESEGEDAESPDDDKIGLMDDSPFDENVVEDVKSEAQEPDNAEQHVGGDEDDSVSTSAKKEPAVASETVPEAGTESSDQIAAEGNGASENTEGLSKEELGRLVASRWTGENVEKERKEGGSAGTHGHDEMPKDAHDEESDSYASENDEDDDHGDADDDNDDRKYEEDEFEDDMPEDVPEEHYSDSGSSYDSTPNDYTDFSDVDTHSNPSWLDKIKQTVQNILQAVNLIKQTPVDKSEADRVRKEYESSSAKLSKIQSRISTLSEKLDCDFGPEKEFYSFYGRCFETKQNKYTYKVCPYKEATQEEGYSRSRLGDWDKFEESYKVMVFANGDKCWNGPDRSMKVRLRCGLTIEMTNVDEPSRCEYVALLSTPAVCLEEKLKELQHKLEAMNKEQPQGHDEL